MSVVSYENLLVLFNVLCYKLACFKKMELKVIKRNKETYFIYIFIDLEGLGPLPTYPWGIKTS